MNEHLGDVFKMRIRRENGQAILHGAGRDPDVIRGNRPTDRPEGIDDDGIPLGRFLIHGHHVDTRRRQKSLERVAVLFDMPTMLKPGLQFSQDDRIDSNRVRLLKGFFDFLIPAHEPGIRGRIYEDSHYFHTSGSIARCLASARSNAAAAAAAYDPQRSSRS